MWGQCTERLKDKLKTGSNFVIVSAAKDVVVLDDMIHVQVHEIMDTRQKKAWTAINVKKSFINYHQDRSGLSDINFYQEFSGRVQGLKTAKVTIGHDEVWLTKSLESEVKRK